ncbi:alpha/beta fold hydrolase [Mycetocola zhadangensis]|jgi:pimeloyl-ACP methyl ester carboxylesterase|uniref:alpha/beta fold hydrolase n=1 Tax=Mycetocola zhadangensis TaxID=1164595 RepID=UPI003A4DD0B0
MILPELRNIIRGTYRHQRFTMPTLFVFGTDDVGFPEHVIRNVFANAHAFGDDTQLALVEGAGHYVIDEKPHETIALITQFFSTRTVAGHYAGDDHNPKDSS